MRQVEVVPQPQDLALQGSHEFRVAFNSTDLLLGRHHPCQSLLQDLPLLHQTTKLSEMCAHPPTLGAQAQNSRRVHALTCAGRRWRTDSAGTAWSMTAGCMTNTSRLYSLQCRANFVDHLWARTAARRIQILRGWINGC